VKKNIEDKERREGEKGEGEDLQPGMGFFRKLSSQPGNSTGSFTY
jgi:hypothetical protein